MIPNISTYSRFSTVLKFKKVLVTSMRTNSHLQHTLTELRRIWTHQTLTHMCRLLGRDIHVYRFGPQDVVGEILVQTCRVVGTDHYIPLSQVCMMSGSPVYRHITPKQTLLDMQSGSLVDVSWQPMRSELNNTIAGEKVQSLLSCDDQARYGEDLLRIHLISDFNTSRQKSLYFCAEDFLERSEVTKDWLNTVRGVACSLCDVPTSPEAETERMEGKMLSLMASIKMALLSSLDLYWNPDKALWQLKNLTNGVQKLSNRTDGSHITSRKVVKDLCILVNILAPHTAHQIWNMLTSAHLSSSTDNIGALDEAMWPEDGAGVKVTSTVYVNAVDSNGKALSVAKAVRPTEIIEGLKEDDYLKILTSGKRFRKRFGSLKMEVLDVSWDIGDTRRWVNVDVTFQASSELDDRMATLRQ